MTPESFRQQYPQGGLVSELAAIDHGQYVVRVLVQHDGRTLTSGLAAAGSVEQAEDLARSRALALLGGSVRSGNVPQAIAPGVAPSQSAPSPNPVSLPKPQVKVPEVVTPLGTMSTDVMANVKADVQTDFKFEMPLSEPLDEELAMEERLGEEPELSPAATVTATPSISEEVLDFSEIIARSDVELKRLGWTSDQGRNYLLETYGKRSRQLLSDDELLEFLRFLEVQPSP